MHHNIPGVQFKKVQFPCFDTVYKLFLKIHFDLLLVFQKTMEYLFITLSFSSYTKHHLLQ